jgi:acetolactate synthase-1/2/3 large subunit
MPTSAETVPGGTLLADRILALGVTTVFALAGASHAPLLIALADRGVTIVSTRHESGTVGAADGYARLTGKLGIALITAEQGLPNAMGAIRTAHDFNSRVLIIATRYPDRWIEPDIEVTVDLHEITAATTKWRGSVPTGTRLGEFFDSAARAASEGRPGVSVLIMPSTYMAAKTPVSPPPLRRVMAVPLAAPSAIAQAVDIVIAAKRPLVIADSPAAQAGAAPGLRMLAHGLGIPVLGMGLGRGLVPEVAPHGYPWPFGQIAADQADVVIVVGATLDMRFGYGLAPRFAANARFVHLSEFAEPIGRNRPVDLAVLGDLANATLRIATSLECKGWQATPWIGSALQRREDRVDRALIETAGDPVHQIEISQAVETAVPPRRIVVGDGADVLNYLYMRVRMIEGGSYADHNPLGSMGMGLPIAIGMAAAEHERAGALARPTILVTGDGSIGFYLAELDSVRRAGLKIIVLVSNDGIWGPEFHGQRIVYQRDINTVINGCDYAAAAMALGMRAERVQSSDALVPAIEAAMAHAGPSLIDVHVGMDGGFQRKTDRLMATVIFDDVARDSH